MALLRTSPGGGGLVAVWAALASVSGSTPRLCLLMNASAAAASGDDPLSRPTRRRAGVASV